MSTARVCREQPQPTKMTKKEAARELSKIFEEDMECKGYSEQKKNSKIKQFVEYVDEVTAARAK
ncbi:MAG: hypothetical protein WB817_09495 [Terriglobales bacterium]